MARERTDETGRALEPAITDLLDARADGASICPSACAARPADRRGRSERAYRLR